MMIRESIFRLIDWHHQGDGRHHKQKQVESDFGGVGFWWCRISVVSFFLFVCFFVFLFVVAKGLHIVRGVSTSRPRGNHG